jgi:very-short-patch-repair endonuclease
MTNLLDCFLGSRQGQAHRRQLRAAGHGSAAITAALAVRDIVRLRPGVYALAPLPVRARHLLKDGCPDAGYLAAARAAIAGLGKGIAAARRTAAVFWGMDMLVEPALLELRGPRGRRAEDKGIDLRTSRSTSYELVGVLGLDAIPMTSAVDTVLDCALSRPMREAVVIADSALRNRSVTFDDLVRGVMARARHPRSARLRRLLHLIDENSGSVLESVLRYLLLQHGYTPESQYTVHRGKLFVGRFDFCLLAARLIIECDGRRWHAPDDIRNTDRRQENALARLGYRVLRFTWDEVLNSPAFVLAAVQDCVALAA